MDVLDGVISELRSLCASLPDKRTGSNIRHEMADFGLSAFSRYLHAEPVVPGPSACTFARAGAFERRDVVRHVAGPDGQPDPRDAGSGDAGQALSALRFAAGTPGDGWWAASLPAPGRPPSGRARRHRILLLAEDLLLQLLAAQARRWGRGISPQHGDGRAGCPGSCPGDTAGPGVRRSPGRAGEAGLREPGGAALAGRPQARPGAVETDLYR